jgi:hypothetical protein
MLGQIKILARLLGMGQGELLQLARDTAGNGALVAVEFLTFAEQARVFQDLSWLRALETELNTVSRMVA